ncbi:MAG: DUF177 domain-containing protein [Rhodospirillales bacterium]|nr:DUF177 domain-containing protein [Rhodospirillales bacterium]
MIPNPPPEFSRRVPAHEIGLDGLATTIEADAKERAALAKRFDLVGLDRLQARIVIKPLSVGGLYRLEGQIEAELAQRCVVTLEPIPARISNDFTRLYGPPQAVEECLDLDPEAEDPPDPLDQGAIDIGEAAAEQLALCLDPYPRKPGAMIDDSSFVSKPDKTDSPFQVLAARAAKKV